MTAMAKEPINIEKQFENYLQRVKLSKAQMSPVQYDETKKAFYAGFSAMIVLCETSIPDLPDAEAELAFMKLRQEAEFYWKINLY